LGKSSTPADKTVVNTASSTSKTPDATAGLYSSNSLTTNLSTFRPGLKLDLASNEDTSVTDQTKEYDLKSKLDDRYVQFPTI
jgi:hypothetical protein